MNKFLFHIILIAFCLPPTISLGDDSRCLEGDCLNGKGIYSYSNGEKYEGQFKNGERHGRGILNFPDGNKYIGLFKNGKRHGQGILSLPDGSYYMGEWEDDLPYIKTGIQQH